MTKWECVTCEVELGTGTVGIAYAHTEDVRLAKLLAELAAVAAEDGVIGADAGRHQEVQRDLLTRCRRDLLAEGAVCIAIGLLDIALWDAHARELGLPLYRLLGHQGPAAVACYASGYLWPGRSESELRDEAQMLVDRGFTAVKTRVGARGLKEDLRRLQIIRDVVGRHREVFADGTFSMNVDEAKAIAENAEGLLDWLEDPVGEHDLWDLRQIRQVSRVPIASGERMSRSSDVVEIADAIDVALLDLSHLGGITPAVHAARYLSAKGIRLSTHSLPELSAQFLLGVGGESAIVEYFDWWGGLFEKGALYVENGLALLGDSPGIGKTFDLEYLDRNQQYLLRVQ